MSELQPKPSSWEPSAYGQSSGYRTRAVEERGRAGGGPGAGGRWEGDHCMGRVEGVRGEGDIGRAMHTYFFPPSFSLNGRA